MKSNQVSNLKKRLSRTSLAGMAIVAGLSGAPAVADETIVVTCNCSSGGGTTIHVDPD